MFLKGRVQKTLYKYRGFCCNVQKSWSIWCFLIQEYRYLRCFWVPRCKENCVNSVVLKHFWELLVLTGFCKRNVWETLAFTQFSQVFLIFIPACNQRIKAQEQIQSKPRTVAPPEWSLRTPVASVNTVYFFDPPFL